MIASEIPGVTVLDVQQTIQKYERLARESSNNDKDKVKAPLDQWIEAIQWTSQRPANISCVSRALKYISLFERHTPSLVDLQDCYQVLSEVTEGTVTKELNNETAEFLQKCLHQLSVKIKNDFTDQEEEFFEKFKPESLEYKKTYTKRKPDETEPLLNPYVNNLRFPIDLLKDNDLFLKEESGTTEENFNDNSD